MQTHQTAEPCGPAARPAKVGATRVVIVDDHPLFRFGVKHSIEQEPDLAVAGESGAARDALITIAVARPDAALIDICLQDCNGLELVKNLKLRFPRLKMLVLSMHEESVYAHRALRAGASGYLMKQEGPEAVLRALRKILRGEVSLSEDLGSRMLRDLVQRRAPRAASVVEELSDRELEVFHLLGEGHSTRSMAETLKLSVKTVEAHRAHIKRKLNLHRACELVCRAVEWAQSERALSESHGTPGAPFRWPAPAAAAVLQ